MNVYLLKYRIYLTFFKVSYFEKQCFMKIVITAGLSTSLPL
jgi:hypothetical protein